MINIKSLYIHLMRYKIKIGKFFSTHLIKFKNNFNIKNDDLKDKL